jgi:hypothetical protein
MENDIEEPSIKNGSKKSISSKKSATKVSLK